MKVFDVIFFEAQSTAIRTSYSRRHRNSAVDTVHAVTVSFGSNKTAVHDTILQKVSKLRKQVFTRTHPIDMWQNNHEVPHGPANVTQTHALIMAFRSWIRWEICSSFGCQWGEGLEVYPAYGGVDKLLGPFGVPPFKDNCGWKVGLHMFFVEVLICWNQSQKCWYLYFCTIIYHEHYYESTLLLIMFIVKFLIVFLKMDIMQWYTNIYACLHCLLWTT